MSLRDVFSAKKRMKKQYKNKVQQQQNQQRRQFQNQHPQMNQQQMRQGGIAQQTLHAGQRPKFQRPVQKASQQNNRNPRMQHVQRVGGPMPNQPENGAMAVQHRTKGWTGVETQPIDPRVNEAIYHRLFLSWPRQLSKSFTSKKYRHHIYELILRAGAFRGYPCYHNPAFAKQVMIDISGLGIIERLFKLHPEITDMGYNGTFLTYKTNDGKYRYGQQSGEDAKLMTNGYVGLLINKFIYNENNNKSLSKSSPTFDGMFGYLRVSVTDSSVTPPGIGPTFSLRRSLPKLALRHKNFQYNSPLFMYKVLGLLIKCNCNTMISGMTGSGKTELQKLLVHFIPNDQKIIMIEDTPETHLKILYPKKDILTWETNEHINLAQQVAESLRNDADWVMVSETRGPEAYQMFQSVKTGHHLTTTLHASSNAVVPSRFAGMCELAPGLDVKEQHLVDDFVNFFDIGVHCDAKKIGGHTFRYIEEVSEFIPYHYTYKDKQGKTHKCTSNGTHPLFRQELINHNGQCLRHYQTFAPSHFLKDKMARTLNINFNMPNVPEGQKESKIKPEIVIPPK